MKIVIPPNRVIRFRSLRLYINTRVRVAKILGIRYGL